jgi:hypothetical protein
LTHRFCGRSRKYNISKRLPEIVHFMSSCRTERWAKMGAVSGVSESAGINRLEKEYERDLQRKPSQ